MRFLHNHVGYGVEGVKRAVLQSPEPLERVPEVWAVRLGAWDRPEERVAAVVGEGGEVARWRKGWFREVRFDAVATAGRWRLEVPEAGVVSGVFGVGEGYLSRTLVSDLLFYLKGQRTSGLLERLDAAACFAGDRPGTADVRGGWYDASADLSKVLSHLQSSLYLLPQQAPMVVWSLLAATERVAAGRLPETPGVKLGPYEGGVHPVLSRLEEEAAHGADALVRLQDAEGYFYVSVMLDRKTGRRVIGSYDYKNRVRGADYAAGWRAGGGMAVAALARAAAAGLGGGAGAGVYREAAVRGWKWLLERGAAVAYDGRENLLDDVCALMAATELARLGEPGAADEAARRAESLMSRQAPGGWWWVDARGGRPFFHAADAGLPEVALLRHAAVEPDARRRAAVEAAVVRSVADTAAITEGTFNPFRLARQRMQPVGGEPRPMFFLPHRNETGYWWQGESATLASTAVKLMGAARIAGVPAETAAAWRALAVRQVDWVLGANPYDACLMYGRGRNNPEFLQEYRNAPGGISNGITGGIDDDDGIAFFEPPHDREGGMIWRWGEQWLPHVAWMLLATTDGSDGAGDD